MKKILLMMAVAALVLASCSSDETVAVNQGDAISFRPLVNGVTRTANGAGVKSIWETGDILYVTAESGSTKFFQDQFKLDATGFNSTNKYYWPNDISTNNVTFAAFWGADYKTWAATGDGLKLASAYTVPDAVASQKDLLFALKTVAAKPADGGVTLNFRHMLSQVVVKVANDQDNLKVTVSGVRIGFLNKTGEFTYSGSVTNTQVASSSNPPSATLIAATDWNKTDNTSKNASYLFEQNLSASPTVLNGLATSATTLTDFSPWIMMPQTLSPATAYTTPRAAAGPVDDTAKELNGAYIALKIAIVDKSSSTPILAEQWCYWPIGTTWNPGYRYTYTVNVGSGGYQPTDQNDNVNLDPVIGNSVIWFQPSCTIDTWVDENYGLSAPIARSESYNFTAGNQVINLDAGANGSYDITITGLTAGHTVTATGTGNFTASPTLSSATVPTDGTVRITGTLTANTTAAATSVITITDTTSSSSITITINQAAPTN